MFTFEESGRFWESYRYNDVKWYDGGGVESALELLRRIWDNFFHRFNNSPAPRRTYVIERADFFIGIGEGEPLGVALLPFLPNDEEWSHKNLYDFWMEAYFVKHHSKRLNRDVSLFEVINDFFTKVALYHKVEFDDDALRAALSVYSWKLARGLFNEGRTISLFNTLYEGSNIVMVRGSRKDDRQDVDAYLKFRGKKVPVSVKNDEVLSPIGVKTWREKKRQTRPQVYCGLDADDNLLFLDTSGAEVDIIDYIHELV